MSARGRVTSSCMRAVHSPDGVVCVNKATQVISMEDIIRKPSGVGSTKVERSGGRSTEGGKFCHKPLNAINKFMFLSKSQSYPRGSFRGKGDGLVRCGTLPNNE